MGLAQPAIPLDVLKTEFVFHFLELVRWPDQRRLEFCVVGESEAGNRMLHDLGRYRLRGEVLQVRHVDPVGTAVDECNAVFIPDAYNADVPSLLKRVGHAPVLTISDPAGFAERGGVIGFIVVGDRLKFEINQRVATGKGLGISAKLLEIAVRVIR